MSWADISCFGDEHPTEVEVETGRIVELWCWWGWTE